MTQLPLGDKDGIQEFLDLGVASLRIGQDLANEVHGTLRQELLVLVKCLLGLRRPFETVGLLQKPIEWETSFTEA